MVGEDISLFDSDVVSPVRHLDIPFKMVDICDWSGMFKMDTDLVG